jgi:hypothetical protein
MDNIPIEIKSQTINCDKIGMLNQHFTKLKIGTILNRSGITKTKGVPPLKIFTALFNLPFIGKNLYQGIVKDHKDGIDKDAVYNFLNSSTYNWRRFTLHLFGKIYMLIKHLLDDFTEEVLILDDSPYDRSRSKKVELLSRVFDHSKKKYLKGFRMLTLGWSDGNSFLGIDFALLSSTQSKNRYSEVNPDIDKRTCGYKRRQEALTKTTEHLVPMVKRALSIGVRAKYILMDSWFAMPSVISSLSSHIDVICMLKDQPKWLYEYNGKKLRLSDLYKKLRKKRGLAKVKASVKITFLDGDEAKIIFVPADNKRGWLAILSTDTTLADNEIIRFYGKRWDIEVFFKMCKQHLKLVKEVQLRSYDGLIGHTSLVIARYNILSLFQRQQVDQRSFGGIFRMCNDEILNISFIEALRRILTFSVSKLDKTYDFSKRMIQAILELIMGQAIVFFGFETSPVALNKE